MGDSPLLPRSSALLLGFARGFQTFRSVRDLARHTRCWIVFLTEHSSQFSALRVLMCLSNIVVWTLFVIAASIAFASMLLNQGQNTPQPQNLGEAYLGCLLLPVIAAFVILIAVTNDLRVQTCIFCWDFILLLGLGSLGIICLLFVIIGIIVFLDKLAHGAISIKIPHIAVIRTESFTITTNSVIRFVVALIGLIASVLGIMQFFR
jgi:hypothetical protein